MASTNPQSEPLAAVCLQDPEAAVTCERQSGRKRAFCVRLLKTMGPGLMVCLADTDGGCLVTAAQSGAEWRYKLLALQILMIPVLYYAQELTVRLGLFRGKGLAGILRDDVGPMACWSVSVPLLLTCLFAVISEMSMIMEVMSWWGVPNFVTNLVTTTALLLLALAGSYSLAEKVGLIMGMMQVLLFITMFLAKPKPDELFPDLLEFPLNQGNFMQMVTANIGAVVMPWMLAYQQCATVIKAHNLEESGDAEDVRDEFNLARADTMIGSVITQGVMAAMVITIAALAPHGSKIDNATEIKTYFKGILGGSDVNAKIFLSFAIIGASMVAAIVVTMCGAWTLEEAMKGTVDLTAADRQAQRGLRGAVQNVQERPVFFATYIMTLAIGFVSTLALSKQVVAMQVYIECLNGILMPPVIFALWYLCSYKLPEHQRLGSCLKWSLAVIFTVCSIFCLVSIPFTLINGE